MSSKTLDQIRHRGGIASPGDIVGKDRRFRESQRCESIREPATFYVYALQSYPQYHRRDGMPRLVYSDISGVVWVVVPVSIGLPSSASQTRRLDAHRTGEAPLATHSESLQYW